MTFFRSGVRGNKRSDIASAVNRLSAAAEEAYGQQSPAFAGTLGFPGTGDLTSPAKSIDWKTTPSTSWLFARIYPSSSGFYDSYCVSFSMATPDATVLAQCALYRIDDTGGGTLGRLVQNSYSESDVSPPMTGAAGTFSPIINIASECYLDKRNEYIMGWRLSYSGSNDCTQACSDTMAYSSSVVPVPSLKFGALVGGLTAYGSRPNTEIDFSTVSSGALYSPPAAAVFPAGASILSR